MKDARKVHFFLLDTLNNKHSCVLFLMVVVSCIPYLSQLFLVHSCLLKTERGGGLGRQPGGRGSLPSTMLDLIRDQVM
jgi:hypothetical protein